MRSSPRVRTVDIPRLAGVLAALALACSAVPAQQASAPAPAAPLAAPADSEPSPAGLWQSVSDVDGKPKALVRIREAGGVFTGAIEQILNPEKRNDVCKQCPGERKGRPLVGLTVIERMRREGETYSGGEILDPDNGNVYRCRLKLIDGGKRLDVRGYLGISLFGRTQTWNRVE